MLRALCVLVASGVAAALPAAAAATGVAVTAQPYAANSMRIRIAPATLPAKAAASLAKQQKLVKERGLSELPSALLEGAGGTAAPLAAGASATHGNLVAKLGADGAVAFSRADTGAALFTATPKFVRPTFAASCTVGALMAGGDLSVANMSIADAVTHCSGDDACVGFTTETASCDASGTAVHKIYFKNASSLGGNDDGAWRRWSKPSAAAQDFLFASVSTSPADSSELVYGLGQGNWTQEGGCPSGPQRVVPLERNGQMLKLQQRKFHVTIPFAYSSLGYGFLFNMPGAGTVTVGEKGGMAWTQEAALGLDFWVSAAPHGTEAGQAPPEVYAQYADATGHAPMLREDAMIFWQSRNRASVRSSSLHRPRCEAGLKTSLQATSPRRLPCRSPSATPASSCPSACS